METLDLDLIEFTLILTVSLDVLGKPFVEEFVRIEEIGHNEVEESPQLSHIILDGGACQEKAVPGLKLFQGVPPLRKDVLNSLGLVQNHELPLQSLEGFVVSDCELVGGDDHVERRVGLLCKLF